MKYSFKERYLLYGGSVIGSLFLIISYIPQIYLTIKTGDVSGQSLGFWTVLVIAILHMLL
ncbi:TPA: PQ-loop domain-containing transporter, partial [Streptococcus suis]